METLCAYIRENAPASSASDHDLGDWPEYPSPNLSFPRRRESPANSQQDPRQHGDDQTEDHTPTTSDPAHDPTEVEPQTRSQKLAERHDKLNAWANTLPAPRVDIQAALTVIGRRSNELVEFERRQERPFALDLRNTNLQSTDLRQSNLDHTLLNQARMEGAYLSEARMEGAKFHSADLKSAALSETFADASVRAADLRSDQVSQEMLNNLFGDTATQLPDGLSMPDHWDDEAIEAWKTDPKFEAWLEQRRASRTS